MEEQRRHNRVSVEGIRCNIMSATEVEIIDMSVGGVALIANGRLEIGRDYIVRIEERGKGFSIEGTIVWCVLSGSRKNSRGENVPLYKAGMKFKEVAASKITEDEVVAFIENHKSSLDKRIIVRFNIKPPEKATVTHALNYRVGKVSMSGMLLEADQPFTIEETYSMDILLGGDKKIDFLGRVASCKKASGSGGGYYNIGIEFLDMSADSRNVLKEFIEAL